MPYIKIPDFLSEYTTEEAHKRMLDNLQKMRNQTIIDQDGKQRTVKLSDYDKSEGSHVWNLTRPFAYELAYQAQYVLAQALSLIWPKGSWGEWLDYHAAIRRITRREGSYASGTVTIEGEEGTVIPAGTVFSTAALDSDNPSIGYITASTVMIGSEGIASAAVRSETIGTAGNTAEDTIIINTDSIEGITAVYNEEALTDGTDEESDDALRTRIVEYDRLLDTSFVGNKNDYRRWALEVDGVGNVSVIPADENPDVDDDSGVITIVITDENGDPFSVDSQIMSDVYKHIIDPIYDTEGTEVSSGYDRLAPPNAVLRVITPEILAVEITVTIWYDGTRSSSEVEEDITRSISDYMKSSINDGVIFYSRIGAIISDTTGVKDYADLRLCGNTANITITPMTMPVLPQGGLVIENGT